VKVKVIGPKYIETKFIVAISKFFEFSSADPCFRFSLPEPNPTGWIDNVQTHTYVIQISSNHSKLRGQNDMIGNFFFPK
jgi:hypothetical protein